MARKLLFSGMYLDDAYEPGWVRVIAGKRWSLTMNPRTYWGCERNRRCGEMMLLIDACGPGLHYLPDDVWS